MGTHLAQKSHIRGEPAVRTARHRAQVTRRKGGREGECAARCCWSTSAEATVDGSAEYGHQHTTCCASSGAAPCFCTRARGATRLSKACGSATTAFSRCREKERSGRRWRCRRWRCVHDARSSSTGYAHLPFAVAGNPTTPRRTHAEDVAKAGTSACSTFPTPCLFYGDGVGVGEPQSPVAVLKRE